MANFDDTPAAEKVPVFVDRNEGPGLVKAEWAKNHMGKGKQEITVPGSSAAVTITKLEVVDNVVSVWTSGDTSLPPEYVIVNPPTTIFIDKHTSIEDPLGAIAHIIDGAKK